MNNLEGRTQLSDMIIGFLEEYREAGPGGGYAEVTDADHGQLYDIIRKLMELKFQPDADGDLPLQVQIHNRHHGYMPWFDLVPYAFDRVTRIHTDESIEAHFRACFENLKYATEQLDRAYRIMEEHKRYAKKRKERNDL